MTRSFAAGLAAAAIALFSGTAFADDMVYAGFPVTVKGYDGKKTTSVSYTGQIARHVLHDSLKKLAGSGNGAENAGLKARMTAYFEGREEGRKILAPTTKGAFAIAQTAVDEISKGKNLADKTYKGAVAGMPNGMTGAELVSLWIDKASMADKGFDAENGYDYPQLISKFIMGAVFYNQAVDGYLDEYPGPDRKPNDKPYKKGAAYTGKEHAWDEAFGYFGAPAHTLKLTPKDVYNIARRDDEGFAAADHDKDGKVDLKTEMAFGPAYYAAGFDASVYDRGNSTSYLHTITRAFLDGRKLLAAANGETLTDAQRAELKGHAAVIAGTWETVLAEAVFKYAGSVYKDMVKLKIIVEANGDPARQFRNYVKHWAELKGFALALQSGRNNLGETATRLNRMMGIGPVLLDGNQVGDIDTRGNYLQSEAPDWGEYMLHMAKIQKLLIDRFGVKARNNDVTGEMEALSATLGDKASAEND